MVQSDSEAALSGILHTACIEAHETGNVTLTQVIGTLHGLAWQFTKFAAAAAELEEEDILP